MQTLLHLAMNNVVYHCSDENFHDMQTMLMTGPSSLLIGGLQTNMIEVDIATQQAINQVC